MTMCTCLTATGPSVDSLCSWFVVMWDLRINLLSKTWPPEITISRLPNPVLAQINCIFDYFVPCLQKLFLGAIVLNKNFLSRQWKQFLHRLRKLSNLGPSRIEKKGSTGIGRVTSRALLLTLMIGSSGRMIFWRSFPFIDAGTPGLRVFLLSAKFLFFHVEANCARSSVTCWETDANQIDSWHDNNCSGVWTGCGQWQSTTWYSTPSRQQVARNETAESLVPLSFPAPSLSLFSLRTGKVSAACSCCWAYSHWTRTGPDWTRALPHLFFHTARFTSKPLSQNAWLLGKHLLPP